MHIFHNCIVVTALIDSFIFVESTLEEVLLFDKSEVVDIVDKFEQSAVKILVLLRQESLVHDVTHELLLTFNQLV